MPLICSAQQDSAIADYLKPILSRIAVDPNAGGWTWEINGNGGYLLRLGMDVTGDGVPELFVTSSLTASKRLAEWTVFDVDKSGKMRPYEKSVRVPADSVWVATEGRSKALIYLAAPDRDLERASDEKPYPVVRFDFVFPEINESIAHVSESEATKLRPSDPNQLPKLQAILLADYFTIPGAKWVDVMEWKLDANDCFFSEEIRERAARNTAFTPQVALSKLGVVQSSSATSSEQSVADQSPTSVRQPLKDATEAELLSSSIARGITIVLIVAALGLLWLLLKRRS